MLKFFKTSIIITVMTLVGAFFLGSNLSGGWAGGFQAVFICSILAVLEISLSFDNAVVNAIKLKKMSPLWRHRFLTWGILIAVFGMRFLFPLIIVSLVGHMNPWDAFALALNSPTQYAEIMLSSHLSISAFGGIFLFMVFLKFFININKEEHWIDVIERPLSLLGHLEAIEITLGLILLSVLSSWVPKAEQSHFLFAGIIGIITYLSVEALGDWLEKYGIKQGDLRKADWGIFLYLEVLDASFSFDGVVGAFAITENLFFILMGLMIGAMFVRSLTVFFVEKSILDGFKYLEHGAFYAVGSLSLSMLVEPFYPIPEWITGVSGAIIIGLSVGSSFTQNCKKTSKKYK